MDKLNRMNKCMKQNINMVKSFLIKNPKPFYEMLLSNHYSDTIIQPCYIPKGKFKETNVDWFGKDDLKIAVMKTDYGYYIQPRERHYKMQFEEYFGFGSGNLGYDKNRTVYVPLIPDNTK